MSKEQGRKEGFVQTNGTALTKLLPSVSRFPQTGECPKKRTTTVEEIKAFLGKFKGIISISDEK